MVREAPGGGAKTYLAGPFPMATWAYENGPLGPGVWPEAWAMPSRGGHMLWVWYDFSKPIF